MSSHFKNGSPLQYLEVSIFVCVLSVAASLFRCVVEGALIRLWDRIHSYVSVQRDGPIHERIEPE